ENKDGRQQGEESRREKDERPSEEGGRGGDNVIEVETDEVEEEEE
ncbi:hypothetical protein CSUI_005010, partial [Cystoisospora suis]